VRTSVHVFLISALSLLNAQPLSYTLLPQSDIRPAPRQDGTIAYDPQRREVFLFGGLGGGPRNDLWVYSIDRQAWSPLRPEGEAPPARFGHTLVLDTNRRWLLLFGGQAGGFFSDVWAYSIDQNLWRRLATDDTGPNRRYGHSAIYDPLGQRMIISHGFTNAGRFDDTWAFDPRTNGWQNLSPSGPRPLRRCLHHAVYNPESHEMLLFGGCASGFGPCPLGDLWSFDLRTNRWTERTAAQAPAAREHYGVGFDHERARLVLFGGQGSGGTLNDTWEWSSLERTWRRAEVQGVPPAPRLRHQGVFAPGLGGTLFFGGSTPSGDSDELWMLEMSGRPDLYRIGPLHSFTGEAGPVSPGEWVTLEGTGFGLRGAPVFPEFRDGRQPDSASGVQVRFDEVSAPLFSVQQGRVDVQVPVEVSGRDEVQISVRRFGLASEPLGSRVVLQRPRLIPRAYSIEGRAIGEEETVAPGSRIMLVLSGYGPTVPPTPSGALPQEGFRLRDPLRVRMDGREIEATEIRVVADSPGLLQVLFDLPGDLAAGSHDVQVRLGIEWSNVVRVMVSTS